MGRYGLISDARIDARVDGDLQTIVAQVCRRIQPECIILTGSFGRGEGSVTTAGDQIAFFSDYDVCVVVSRFGIRQILSDLSRSLSTEIGVPVSLMWVSPAMLRAAKGNNASFGRAVATVFSYELASASMVLYGNKPLRRHAIDPSTIPLWDGAMILLNKMAQCLDGDASSDQLLNKLLMACGDVLLLNAGLYHFSRVERRNRLSRIAGQYTFLEPSQFSDILTAYDAKLFATYDIYRDCDPDSWNCTTDRVLRFALKSVFGLTYECYSDFGDRYVEHSRLFPSSCNYSIYSIGHPLIDNAIFLARLRRLSATPSWAVLPLATRATFKHVVYSLVPPLLYCSLRPVHEQVAIMARSRHVLSMFGIDAAMDLPIIRQATFQLWYRLCFGRHPEDGRSH